MLLEVVSFIRNVGNHFVTISEAHFGDFTDGRIRLLRRAGHDLHADATTERVTIEGRGLGLGHDLATSFAHELVDGRHG